MQKFFTDFGEIEAPDAQTARTLAHERWLEQGWKQGGYKPWTRAEFEQHKAAELVR